MPATTAEDRARQRAASEALKAPAIPATQQAIADAGAHNKALVEGEALAALTAPRTADELPRGYVLARILKLGHEKIYTGQIDGTNHDAAGKFTRFKFGEIVPLPLEVAQAQEANGYVEIQG